MAFFTPYALTADSGRVKPGSDWDKQLSFSGAPASTTLAFSVAKGATEVSCFWGALAIPIYALDGPTDWVFYSVLSTTNSNLYMTVQLHRVNNSDVVQVSSSESAEQLCDTNRTFTFTGVDLGPWSVGDALRVDVKLRNASTMAVSALAFTIGSGGTRMDITSYDPDRPAFFGVNF